MKRITLKPEVISGIIVLALTGYFGYYFYLNYQQGVSKIQEDVNHHQHTQEFRMKLAESLQEAQDLQGQLAPEATSEWLLERLGALAKEAGVDITSASSYPPRQLDRFIQPAVSLQLMTSYHRLGKFLSVVERATPFLRVDEMDVSHSGNPEQPARVRMTLSTVYAPRLDI